MSARAGQIADAVRLLRADFDSGIVIELLSTYLDDSMAYGARIESALAAHDLPALASAAHGIKGSVANFSADEAVRLADDLQKSANAGAPLETLRMQFERLQDELLQVRACLEQQRAALYP